jgi:hypothetical protein
MTPTTVDTTPVRTTKPPYGDEGRTQLLDRLAFSLDEITLRQCWAVLVAYDSTIRVATVDDLIGRNRRPTPHEVDATAKRIIATRLGHGHDCIACDSTGWKYHEPDSQHNRGSVSPCPQCQRERAAGWRAEVKSWQAGQRSTVVPNLTADECKAADAVAAQVRTAMSKRVSR